MLPGAVSGKRAFVKKKPATESQIPTLARPRFDDDLGRSELPSPRWQLLVPAECLLPLPPTFQVAGFDGDDVARKAEAMEARLRGQDGDRERSAVLPTGSAAQQRADTSDSLDIPTFLKRATSVNRAHLLKPLCHACEQRVYY